MTPGLLLLILLVGVPLFLLFEHPVIFWLLVVPIAIIGGIKFVAWLKK